MLITYQVLSENKMRQGDVPLYLYDKNRLAKVLNNFYEVKYIGNP